MCAGAGLGLDGHRKGARLQRRVHGLVDGLQPGVGLGRHAGLDLGVALESKTKVDHLGLEGFPGDEVLGNETGNDAGRADVPRPDSQISTQGKLEQGIMHGTVPCWLGLLLDTTQLGLPDQLADGSQLDCRCVVWEGILGVQVEATHRVAPGRDFGLEGSGKDSHAIGSPA